MAVGGSSDNDDIVDKLVSQVPTFHHRNKVINESMAICEYLQVISQSYLVSPLLPYHYHHHHRVRDFWAPPFWRGVDKNQHSASGRGINEKS